MVPPVGIGNQTSSVAKRVTYPECAWGHEVCRLISVWFGPVHARTVERTFYQDDVSTWTLFPSKSAGVANQNTRKRGLVLLSSVRDSSGRFEQRFCVVTLALSNSFSKALSPRGREKVVTMTTTPDLSQFVHFLN